MERRQNEELLEARRLRRQEQKRRLLMRQRVLAVVLLVIVILSLILILRGCRNRREHPELYVKKDSALELQTEPDATVNIAAVGDIMITDDLLADAKQPDGSYQFAESFAAVSGYTLSADFTIGNLECNFCGEPYAGKPDYRAPDSLATTLSTIGFDLLQTANTCSIQNGLSGLQSTIDTLTNAGIDHAGTYTSEAPHAEKRKKKSKAPLVIGIIAGVLVLAAVLWGLIGRTLFAPYWQSESVDPSPNITAQTSFWNGGWYGWWIIESGTGAYKDHANSWWDACARIDLGSDGSGTLTLWDDSCAAGQTIADAQVQADSDLTTSGRLVSTDGSFFDCALSGADAWYIDAAAPEAMPYPYMICISGVYTDPEDSGNSFVYTIYLRPWGMDWEDVRADNESLLPYFYDDWYLPLIESGASVPNAIGGSPA